MFNELEKINERPEPFQFYTADELWTDEYRSQQMLAYHLNEAVDLSSRRGEFIQDSVKWIASEFKIGSGTRIVDFGCGPGLYCSRLAGYGARVTGIDFSRRSIEYACEQAEGEKLSVSYVHQNYLDFDTEDRFDLAMMIMCDFCALSPGQRKRMLDTFYRILKPGGAVLLDVYSLSAYERREEASFYELNQLSHFWSPKRYFGFVNTFKYDDEKVVLDKYTIVEPERSFEIYNWLQYFVPDDLERAFREAGFSVRGRYADVAGAPFDPEADEFAIVAEKRP